jgi:hypothetical protein
MNAPGARTPPKRRTAAHHAPASKPARKGKPKAVSVHRRALITPGQRQNIVAEAAYCYAEHRGFVPGYELDDWLAAEDQIDATLTLGDTPTPCGS